MPRGGVLPGMLRKPQKEDLGMQIRQDICSSAPSQVVRAQARAWLIEAGLRPGSRPLEGSTRDCQLLPASHEQLLLEFKVFTSQVQAFPTRWPGGAHFSPPGGPEEVTWSNMGLVAAHTSSCKAAGPCLPVCIHLPGMLCSTWPLAMAVSCRWWVT